MRHRSTWVFLVLLGATGLVLAAAEEATQEPEPQALDVQAFGEQYGFQPMTVRLASAGYMVDFRYRVVDAEKAWKVFQDTLKPYLIHQESGARLIVPSPAYVGPLAQTGEKPKQDRNYFIFFSNPGRLVEKGDTVTIYLGEIVVGPLTVR